LRKASRNPFGARHKTGTSRISRGSAELAEGKSEGELPLTEEAGETRWYLYLLEKQALLEEPADIVAAIRCTPETPRRCIIEQAKLSEIRGKIEKHIKNTFLKAMQAPIDVKPILKAWMELN